MRQICKEVFRILQQNKTEFTKIALRKLCFYFGHKTLKINNL